jgi:nucleotide-binding universal stress UspA family protein
LIAKQMNARVLFMHVVSERQPVRVMHLKANRARVRLMLQAEKAMAHAPDLASVEIHIGKPRKVIAEIAAQWNADLIVLASPVSRRYDRILGTTAERIVRSVACPVLLVNQEPLDQYKQIAVASDLSATSVRVAHAVRRLSLMDEAFAWFVHAAEPAFNGSPVEAAAALEELEQRKTRWRKIVSAELSAQLVGAGLDLSRVRIAADFASPLEAVEEIVEKLDPELLVIGTSRWFVLKRMLLRSVAHQILKRVSCDILAVPPQSNWNAERVGDALLEEIVWHPSTTAVAANANRLEVN